MGKVRKLINQSNDGVLCTKNLILRSMCFVYLCAFLGFYCQSPGLYGNNGILPARLQIDTKNSISAIHNKPTLLHFSSYLGLNTQYMVELLSILGALVAFTGYISQTFCILPIFATLWSLYFSLIQISQTFKHQSDELLLEAGFLCLFLAPFNSSKKSGVADKIGIVMLKWLLFRFLFDSGSVKFFSGCPYWWSFTGLSRHFETLPLPTPFSWFCHHLPPRYLKISTLFTHISELICPWFFFFPSRSVRVLLFYWEVYLQLTIILSGNYGFLNFLVITLLFSLLDDRFFEEKSKTRAILATFFTTILFTVIFYIVHIGFGHNLEKILFKYEHIALLRSMVKLSPLLALVAVIITFLTNVVYHPCIKHAKSFWSKASEFNTLLAFTLCGLALIGVSVVPHSNLDAATNITNTQLGRYYKEVNRFNIVNEYGRHLRKMRSERLEVTLEYAQNAEGTWHEIPFVYKPWTAEDTSLYAGPYLPRLDMKFYDIVNNNYRDEPWILSLAYRILRNEQEVLNLFGIKEKLKPTPKFVKATLNRFKYTPLSEKDEPTMWITKVQGVYFAPFSADSATLQAHLKNMKILTIPRGPDVHNQFLKNILDTIRTQSQRLEPHVLIFAVAVSGLLIILTKK